MAVGPPPMPRGGASVDTSVPRVRGRLAPEAMFPAALPGYRTAFVTLRTGERIRVAESGAPEGEPVVFFPGWGCPIWDFHRTVPAVAAAGYRAIAVELRGHGRSDMPVDEELYTTDAMVSHAIDILDAIGVARAALIGHSMGGALAMHLAMRAPQRVRGLALISPIGFGIARIAEIGRLLSPTWVIPVSRALLRRSLVAVGLRLVYGGNAPVTPRNVDEYWAPSQFDGFVPAMRALLHGFRWSRFTAAEMAQVEVPGLLVRGSRDPVVERPRDPVPLPAHWREVVIDGAGHLPHDEAPDQVNAAIVAFLTGLGVS